jgi:hypothetical protein
VVASPDEAPAHPLHACDADEFDHTERALNRDRAGMSSPSPAGALVGTTYGFLVVIYEHLRMTVGLRRVAVAVFQSRVSNS